METKYINATDRPLSTAEFAPTRVMAAIELGPTDAAVLSYLHFLLQHTAVKQLTLAHVIPQIDLFSLSLNEAAGGLMRDFDLRQEIEARLEQFAAQLQQAQPDLEIALALREGPPLGNLLDLAGSSAADLVVIGQANTGPTHGILARNLVRKTQRDVLMVPTGVQPRLQTILVPVDFSSHSARAFGKALALQQSLGNQTRIILVHVFELPTMFAQKVRESYRELKDFLTEDRQKAMADFLAAFGQYDLNQVTTILLEQGHANPADLLYQYALDIQADLVVIAARGHSSVELLLLGSITERLLALNEHTPLLIIK